MKLYFAILLVFMVAISSAEWSQLILTREVVSKSPSLVAYVNQRVTLKGDSAKRVYLYDVNGSWLAEGQTVDWLFKNKGVYSYTFEADPEHTLYYIEILDDPEAKPVSKLNMAEPTEDEKREERNKVIANSRKRLYDEQQQQAQDEADGLPVKEGPYGDVQPNPRLHVADTGDQEGQTDSTDSQDDNTNVDNGGKVTKPPVQTPSPKPTRSPASTRAPDSSEQVTKKPATGTATTKPPVKPTDKSTPTEKPEATAGGVKSTPTPSKANDADASSNNLSSNTGSVITYSLVLLVLSSIFPILI